MASAGVGGLYSSRIVSQERGAPAHLRGDESDPVQSMRGVVALLNRRRFFCRAVGH